jgi:formate-dependent nitrite reductase membrane component NrfD
VDETRASDKERRLHALRREAESLGSAGDAGIAPRGSPLPPLAGQRGYYGQPLLKAPVWTWEVPAYFFVGGAAGAAAVIAAVARSSGAHPALVRDARWIAASGALASPALLISDLGRPERFLNMLRVFKLRSPMSVGAWTLVAFSSAASAAAFADLVAGGSRGRVPAKVIGDAAGMLAAATGLVLATYTGVLIGATAIPVWSRNVRLLPIQFGGSGLGAAVSLLELLGHRDRALNRIGIGAAVVETLVGFGVESRHDPALEPIRHGRSGTAMRAGGILSGPVPLALRLLASRSATARTVAAVSTILGSLLTRVEWLDAGRESAAGGPADSSRPQR